MKVLAFVLSVLLSTALVAGGTILIVTQSPAHSFDLDLLAVFALTVFIYGPLLLGSLTSYWDVRRSEGSRAYFRRVLWIVLGMDVLAAVAVVVFAIVVRTSIWFAIVSITVAAALMVVALTVGRVLLRHEQAHPEAEEPWRPVTRRELRRKVLIIAVTFIVLFAVGIMVFGVLLSSKRNSPSAIGSQVGFAFQFATIGAALAAIIVSIPLNRRLRSTVSGDLGTIRKVAKVVLGNKKLELDHTERVAAAKYATIIPTVLAFMLSYLTLLYLGLGTQQVRMILDGHNEPFNIGFIVLLFAVLLVLVPYYAVRIRRAHNYARDHAALLSHDEQPADG